MRPIRPEAEGDIWIKLPENRERVSESLIMSVAEDTRYVTANWSRLRVQGIPMGLGEHPGLKRYDNGFG